MDGRLYQFLDPPLHKRQRFYPPGKHPAIRRHVEMLKRLGESGFGESEAADYHRDLIAAFEQGESEAKAEALARLDARS